jgi:hypothetical protein
MSNNKLCILQTRLIPKLLFEHYSKVRFIGFLSRNDSTGIPLQQHSREHCNIFSMPKYKLNDDSGVIYQECIIVGQLLLWHSYTKVRNQITYPWIHITVHFGNSHRLDL